MHYARMGWAKTDLDLDGQKNFLKGETTAPDLIDFDSAR